MQRRSSQNLPDDYLISGDVRCPTGALAPTSTEELRLPGGAVIHVPKATPVFRSWSRPISVPSYGGKAILDLDGEELYAELAILRLLERDGWQGAWIDTYRRKMFCGVNTEITLPPAPSRLLAAIHGAAGSSHGCFDVFAWTDTSVLFAESKRTGRDRVRPSQLGWLQAAIRIGLALESFLIVQWTVDGDH